MSSTTTMNPLTIDIDATITELPLKEMDGSLLTLAILEITKDWEGAAEIRTAIQLAAHLHRNQTRAERGVMPRDHYITHPLRNTMRLIRWGVRNVKVLVASILHDVVEDCTEEILAMAGLELPAGYTAQVTAVLELVITRIFGPEVARILAGVTNPEIDKSLPRAERQEIYRQHVRHGIDSSVEVFLVKLADLIDNAGSLHHTMGGSPQMALSGAAKYGPLLPYLLEALEQYNPFSAEVQVQVRTQVEKVVVRLEQILAGKPVA